MENNTNVKKAPESYLPVFCQALYQLCRAGITPAGGIELLLEDETQSDLRALLEQLHARTEEGLPLGEAMRETGAFPDYMTDMITLAENVGRLEDTLPALQRYYERKQRLRGEIRGAVTMPVVLLAVMIAVVALLITQVLPVFDRVFAQLGVTMGGAALGMMRLGAGLARAGTVLAAIAAVLAVAALTVGLIPPLRERFTGWCRRSFGGRGILGRMAVSRFASAMSMATASGMGMEESVPFAAKICGGAREIDEKTAACAQRIDEGESPAEALAGCGLFPGRDCSLIRLAERTGALPETLEALSSRLEEECERDIDRVVGTIEPAIVLVTGALAGVILLSVMLPMMGLLSGMG